MNDFKEWLSDNLRYFIVGAVVILIIGGAILGIKIYSNAVNGGTNDKPGNVVIEQESDMSETQTETADKKDKEKETDSEKDSEKETKANLIFETEPESKDAPETETQEAPQTEAPQTEPPQTEPPQTEPPKPVYLTITSACYMRSYPDYGDNIIGEYGPGTTVQFLGEEAGWYKVTVNGQTGYMGPKFFE